jgi:hypothetical protein
MADNFEKDYYLILSADIKTYPLIYEDCDRLTCSYINRKGESCARAKDCPAFIRQKKKVNNPQKIIMDFETCISQKPVIYADYYMPMPYSLETFAVSQKLYTVLSSMEISGIQLIPVSLMENNVIKYDNFWYVHIYNNLNVLDKEKSRFFTIGNVEASRKILEIKFLTEKLNKIHLEKRLIFRLNYTPGYIIIHKSIVQKLTALNPIGVQFIKISDYQHPQK